MAQAVACLPYKSKALSSNPNPTKKKERKSYLESKVIKSVFISVFSIQHYTKNINSSRNTLK
jgi:hypothetical protein